MINPLLTLSKIKHSPRVAFIRKFTNLLYYDPNTITLKLRDFDFLEVDGSRFYATNQINSIMRVIGNPWFEGVSSTDIALDIGANIGSVAIPLARKVSKVYTVEPIYSKELYNNIKLNSLTNIEVLERAVGPESGHSVDISFAGRTKRVKTVSFKTLKTYIISNSGYLDFLKMDGEGCEWDILPRDLYGIRELRIEFHIRRGRIGECKHKYKMYLEWMNREGYKITIEEPKYSMDPYDKEDFMVRATLR